jgi:hypothetical protein
MDRYARESLKRAAECARLADAESDPQLKAYLIKLALSWMKVATAETDQHDRRSLSDLCGPARLDDSGRRPAGWPHLRGRIGEHARRPAMDVVDHSLRSGIVTSGRAATLDQAKAEFQRSWIAWTKQSSTTP